MVTKLNNVNVERIAREAEGLRADPNRTRRTNKLEAVWNNDASRPQLHALVKYEQGEVTMECDSPSFMGGEGRRPGPMQYCIMGFAACFVSTFATAAASRNIALKRLSVVAECELDFSKVYGITEDPVVRNASFTVNVQADVPREELEELKEESLARCPGVFVLTHKIPVTARIA